MSMYSSMKEAQLRITSNCVKEFFDYDPLTGKLTWKRAPSKFHERYVGKEAGSISKSNGYRIVSVENCMLNASVIIWLYMTGEWPTNILDHKNRIRSDNKWENLRLLTPSQSALNQNIYSTNKSGLTGVSWYRPCKKWVAYIGINGKNKNLGYFHDKYEAYKTYLTARYELLERKAL